MASPDTFWQYAINLTLVWQLALEKENTEFIPLLLWWKIAFLYLPA